MQGKGTTVTTWFLRALMLATLVFGCAYALYRPSSAFACSCVSPPAPPAARDNAIAVFSGQVTGIDAPTGLSDGPGNAVHVTFAVSEVWKGPAEPTITVVTSGSSASCGYEFTPGEQYMVYAGLDDTRFTASLCSRTAPLAQAADDIRALGAGTRPAPAPAAPPPAAAQTWALYGAAALVALAAAGGVFALRRRSRQA